MGQLPSQAAINKICFAPIGHLMHHDSISTKLMPDGTANQKFNTKFTACYSTNC